VNMSSVSSDRKPLSSSSAKDGGRGQYADDENKERGNWTGRLDFVLSLVGSVCQSHDQIRGRPRKYCAFNFVIATLVNVFLYST